jgi:hypothetical protein
MDFNALQHKLFQMDPSDPAEDLRKLAAQAHGGGNMDAPPTKNYLEESADVSKGSMPLDIASISDFAALAGVVTEGKQKTGSAGQAKGKDPMPKAKPGRTEHPLKDKLVGEDDRIAALESRVAQLEVMLAEATKDKVIKARDPNAQYMNDLRKSGAMGAHKDKKKDAKAGKQKHKGKAYESITDELWAMLREK